MTALRVMAALALAVPSYASAVQVRGKAIYVDGRPFTVKGIHYGPWRPGAGPGKGYPYPGPQQIDEDLRLIQRMNVNTILVADPPGYVLDLAGRYGLKVFYSFYLNWWPQSQTAAAAERESVLKRVREFRDKPALLGWVLGNEIPLSAIEQRGDDLVKSLAALYRDVKQADERHPVTHSNWPAAKDLDLSFFDVISFNVYPLWPRRWSRSDTSVTCRRCCNRSPEPNRS